MVTLNYPHATSNLEWMSCKLLFWNTSEQFGETNDHSARAELMLPMLSILLLLCSVGTYPYEAVL